MIVDSRATTAAPRSSAAATSSPSRSIYFLRRNRPPTAAMPPPMTKPATAAPMSDLLLVLAQLLAPVGDLGDLAAQVLQRARERGAVGLDRRADLLRGARAAISAPRHGRLGVRRRDGLLDAACASSMAICRRRRRARLERAVGEEAGQRAEQEEEAGDHEEAPEVLAVGERDRPVGQPREAVQAGSARPKMAKTPAAAPIAAPCASLVTFWVTSALASSISSRTSSWARSETSWIAWRDGLAAGRSSVLVGHRRNRLRKRAATRPPAKAAPTSFRLLAVDSAAASTRRGVRGGCRRCAAAASASVATGVGSAPAAPARARRRWGCGGPSLTRADLPRRRGARPWLRAAWSRSSERPRAASRPDHGRRLTMSLSHRAPTLPATACAAAVQAAADRLDDEAPWPRSNSASPCGSESKIQPVSTCSIAP